MDSSQNYKIKTWNAALYLVDAGFSKGNFAHFEKLPRELLAEIEKKIGCSKRTRTLRSIDWMRNPHFQILVSNAIFTYQELYPYNASFERNVKLSELADVYRILKLEYEHLPDDFRADHIFQAISFVRDGTLRSVKCRSCRSVHLVHAEFIGTPCPVCKISQRVKALSVLADASEADLESQPTPDLVLQYK